MSEDAATERTGDPAVDVVLAEVESVGLHPLPDQVSVYERAHERLRRALDAPEPDPEPGPERAMQAAGTTPPEDD